METAEDFYYLVCEKYRHHCNTLGVSEDDAKFQEFIETSYKEYAEFVAQKALKNAAQRAEVDHFYFDGEGSMGKVIVETSSKFYKPEYHVSVNMESITTTPIELP
jgi:hypothetical protein